jgi:hypothetical protein
MEILVQKNRSPVPNSWKSSWQSVGMDSEKSLKKNAFLMSLCLCGIMDTYVVPMLYVLPMVFRMGHLNQMIQWLRSRHLHFDFEHFDSRFQQQRMMKHGMIHFGNSQMRKKSFRSTRILSKHRFIEDELLSLSPGCGPINRLKSQGIIRAMGVKSAMIYRQKMQSI